MKQRKYLVGWQGEKQVIYGKQKHDDSVMQFVERLTINQAKRAILRMNKTRELIRDKVVPKPVIYELKELKD